MNTEYLTELNRVPLKSDDNVVVVYAYGLAAPRRIKPP